MESFVLELPPDTAHATAHAVLSQDASTFSLMSCLARPQPGRSRRLAATEFGRGAIGNILAIGSTPIYPTMIVDEDDHGFDRRSTRSSADLPLGAFSLSPLSVGTQSTARYPCWHLYTVMQRLRCTARLGGDRDHRRPARGVLARVIQKHPNRSGPNLAWKLAYRLARPGSVLGSWSLGQTVSGSLPERTIGTVRVSSRHSSCRTSASAGSRNDRWPAAMAMVVNAQIG